MAYNTGTLAHQLLSVADQIPRLLSKARAKVEQISSANFLTFAEVYGGQNSKKLTKNLVNLRRKKVCEEKEKRHFLRMAVRLDS